MASISTPQIVVALGSVEAGLVEPVLAPHQQIIHNPTDADLARADAAIVRAAYRVDRELLDRMPALKVIARTGVGTDLVDVAEANRRGIPVVITPGSNTASVAEGVFCPPAGTGQEAIDADGAGPGRPLGATVGRGRR